MIQFISLKKNNVQINLLESSIDLNTFEDLVKLLNRDSSIDIELVFKINKANRSEQFLINKTSILKEGNVIEENSFFNLVKAELGIILDANILKSRFLQAISLNDLEASFNSLNLTTDPELETKINSKTQQQTELKTQLLNALDEDQKSKFTRLEEVTQRIASIQVQVDFYQNEKKIKEELNSNIKKYKIDKENINQMLQSVELLIENKESLNLKLKSFEQFADSYDKVKELKIQKINYLNSKLSIRPSPGSSILEDDIKEAENKSSSLNLFLIIPIINLLITFVIFLVTYNVVILLIGIVFTVLLMIIYIISRFFKDSLEDVEELNNKAFSPQADSKEGVAEAEDPNTQLFINSAWAKAIKDELEVVDENITKSLNGKSYEALKQDLTNLDLNIEKENNKLEELTQKAITSDEYYKKRREIDILKIEKENLEYGLKLEPTINNKIQDLSKEIENLKLLTEMGQKTNALVPVFIKFSENLPQIEQIKQIISAQVILVRLN